jgi:hypothetical protein
MQKLLIATGLGVTLVLGAGCSSTMKKKVTKHDQQILMLRDDADALRTRVGELERQLDLARQDASNAAAAVGQLRSDVEKKLTARRTATTRTSPTGRAAGADGIFTGAGGPYHLRVVSLPANERGKEDAERVIRILRARGVKGAVMRMSSGAKQHWVVDVGAFPSSSSSEARALKQSLRSLPGVGGRFRDTYWVKY